MHCYDQGYDQGHKYMRTPALYFVIVHITAMVYRPLCPYISRYIPHEVSEMLLRSCSGPRGGRGGRWGTLYPKPITTLPAPYPYGIGYRYSMQFLMERYRQLSWYTDSEL